jgi:hypothetical protein
MMRKQREMNMTKKQIKQFRKEHEAWNKHLEYRHSIGLNSGVKETDFNSSYWSIAAALGDMQKAEQKLQYEVELLEKRKVKYDKR